MRRSFTYLREFYIGELYPEDRCLVPLEEELPSADFMHQLREFCDPWRYTPPDEATVVHKSF